MKTILVCLIFLSLMFFGDRASAQETWVKSGLDNLYISKILTTPYGVLAAEFDSRLWLNPLPYNGVRISKDLGNTWVNTGLERRGVTDLAYDNGIIYATTYYSGADFRNGMYLSADGGNSWQQSGFFGSSGKVYAHNGTIYVSRAGAGLWISKDMGQTWEIKIGPENSDYEITALSGKDKTVIVGTILHTYISNDNGETWAMIADLEANTIINIAFGESSIIAIGRENRIFRSTNAGISWQKIQSNPNLQPEKIFYFENAYYLGQKNLTNGLYDLYRSDNTGTSWHQMGLSKTKSITTISGLYASPKRLLAHVNVDGVYTSTVESALEAFPLLQIPWQANNKNELVGRIYSYFDHKYPLLGYNYYKEPNEESETTLNYQGDKQEVPELYYSSHDGYDFSLPYGTEVLAAREGLAEYYYCKPCGNTIKINHPDGYQTTYMHLQETGLITKGTRFVQSGEVIGRVGMTGNTTGPHLHFAVTKGIDIPENRIDPFGWQSSSLPDPWKNYGWTDILGAHTGPQSTYLWKDTESVDSKYLLDQNINLMIDNKSIRVTPESVSGPATVSLKTGKTPIFSLVQKNLSYVLNSAVVINAIDNLGSSIENLIKTATIEINIPEQITQTFIKASLKIYFLNKNTGLWEPLETVYDEITNKLIAETLHFSDFAVFGEKLDSYVPETSFNITGELSNYWYIEYPMVSFTTQNPADTIFYSTDGEYWDEYTEPFVISQDGIITISYRSLAQNGNLEETKHEQIKVDSKGTFVKTITINGARFSVQ